MVSNLEKKDEVVALRKEGLTYSEISKKTGLQKGAISRLISGVIFSEVELQKIKVRQAEQKIRGLTKLRLAKEMKKKFTERTSLIEAKKIFEKHKKDSLFLMGTVLYWSEGSFTNKYFQYGSSDGEKIILMLDWMRRYLGLDGRRIKFRLFSPINKIKENQAFWASFTGNVTKMAITTYETQNKTKNVGNKGFLQVLCYDITVLQKVLFWQKLLLEYYHKAK